MALESRSRTIESILVSLGSGASIADTSSKVLVLVWGLVGILSAVVVASMAYRGVAPGIMANVLWLAFALLLLSLLSVAGYVFGGGRCAGFLITENNVMSASRAQAAIWFVAILSTWLVLELLAIHGKLGPVAFNEGTLLVTVVGSGSLTVAPLLNAAKSGKTKDDRVALPKDVEADGVLWRNASLGGAHLQDIFQGDEIRDGDKLDLGKIQMLVLTLALAGAYVVQFLVALSTATPHALPDVDPSTATFLGISHAGYLGNKIPVRTPTLTT